MTVSEDFRPTAVAPAGVTAAGAVVPAQATPPHATPPQGTAIPAPATPLSAAPLPARVRGAVDALRRGMEDGSVHHHRRNGLPESWTAVGVEVVRAWTAGLDVDEQHAVCRTCAD